MLEYREILVAIDCSEVDEIILNHVSVLARKLDATLHLLHVVHSHTLDQERYLRQRSQTILEGHRNKLQAEGIAANILIRSGEPETEILNEIEERSYDLIAMATSWPPFTRKNHVRQRFTDTSRKNTYPPASRQT